MNGYVTTSETGDLLGVSASRVRQFILEGRLPARKIGNTLLVPTRSIASFRAKRAKGSKKQVKHSNGNGK